MGEIPSIDRLSSGDPSKGLSPRESPLPPERIVKIARAVIANIYEEGAFSGKALTSQSIDPISQFIEKMKSVYHDPGMLFEALFADKEIKDLSEKFPEVQEKRQELLEALEKNECPPSFETIRRGCDKLIFGDLEDAKKLLGENFELLHRKKLMDRGFDIRIRAGLILMQEKNYDEGFQFLKETLPESRGLLYMFFLPKTILGISPNLKDLPEEVSEFPYKDLKTALSYAPEGAIDELLTDLYHYFESHQFDEEVHSFLVQALLLKGDYKKAIHYLTMKGTNSLMILDECPRETLEKLQNALKKLSGEKIDLLASQIVGVMSSKPPR